MSINDEEKLSRKDRYNQRERRQHHSGEKRKKRSIWKVIVTLLVLTIISVGAYATYTWFNLSKNIDTGFKNVNNTEAVGEDFNKFSVLIMGIDENDSRAAEGQTRENSRTDSLVYISVNKDTKRMDMVSIPRDSLTLMRDAKHSNDESAHFFDKITHAYAYGGTEGTIDAVKNLLHVPVNFYAVINFKAFEQVIDSLGGVEVYVPFDMVEQNANGEMGTIELKQGLQTLNGEKALAFARSRYYDSDIERGQRQLQIIHAVVNKAKSLNALVKVNELIEIAGDNVTHNMSMAEITAAASMVASGDMEIVSHRLGGYDAEMNGVYYYYPRPTHLLYISSIINNSLGKAIPRANDLLNIHYQGYITPLSTGYTRNVLSPASTAFIPFNYVLFSIEDYIDNIPDRLTKEDLKNDPTVSDENRPAGIESTTTE